MYYFGESMDNNNEGEKEKIRKERQNILKKTMCEQTVNRQSNKH